MTASGQYVYIFPERFNAIEELTLTATQIALQNFVWDYVTFVFFNSTLVCGVDLFLQSYRKNTIVGKGTFYPKFVDQTHQYVVFGLNIADIVQVLNWMQNHEFDNTGKYIIVCQSQDLDSCDETKAVRVLWAHKVTNVVFLKSVENNVLGYTYFPLTDSDCKTDVPVKITNLNSCNKTLSKICYNLFATKLHNFNNCPLLASSFIQPPYMSIEDGMPSGANGDLLVILADKLNASLEVMTPRIGSGWGKLDINGTWSGSLADVYYDYANLSITSAALTLARSSSFHMSIGYNTAGVVWVTHPAKIMSSSLKLTRPFQTNVQLAVLMCFLLVVIYAVISRSRLCYCGRASKPSNSILFYSWMICMGLPSTRLPTKAAYIYVMLLWMWFCILIRTFYQVSLMTVLKANYYFGEFQTIDDVIAAGYPFGGGAALKDYFIEYPDIYDLWTDVKADDIIPTLRNLSEGFEFVLAMSMESAQTIISTEKLNIHILPQKIISCPTVIFYKKFSPIADSVNKILVQLIESGFSDYLKQKYSTTPKKNQTGNTLEAINIYHYSSCYVVLLTGWVVSFLFFVGEILFARMHKKPCKCTYSE